MSDSYEFLKAHFDRILHEQIADRVELLEAARAAFVFLDSVDWTCTPREADAADTMDRLEAAIKSVESDEPTRTVDAVDPHAQHRER